MNDTIIEFHPEREACGGMGNASAKVCTKCHVEKPLEAFGKDAKTRDGLTYRCKACASACHALRVAANREQREARAQATLAAGGNKVCRVCKQSKPVSEYYLFLNNKDGLHTTCRACKRADWHTNFEAKKEIIRERHRNYHARNQETVNRKAREYYHTHPEISRQRTQRYQAQHPGKRRAAQKRWAQRNSARLSADKNARLRARRRGESVPPRPGKRLCLTCWYKRPESEFATLTRCQSCEVARKRHYYQANRERLLANRKQREIARVASAQVSPYTWRDRERDLRRSGMTIDVDARSERIADRSASDPVEAVFARQLEQWLRKALSPQEQAFVRAFAENGLDMDAACAECDVPYGVAKKLLAGVQQRARASFGDESAMRRAA